MFDFLENVCLLLLLCLTFGTMFSFLFGLLLCLIFWNHVCFFYLVFYRSCFAIVLFSGLLCLLEDITIMFDFLELCLFFYLVFYRSCFAIVLFFGLLCLLKDHVEFGT